MSTEAPVFYFAAMSPYSWMSAERIEQVLPAARWTPVTAAFIFKAAGRVPWGLTDERDQGIADCEQRARERGLGEITWPEPWPTSDIPVARAMTYADSIGRLRPYALSAMRLAFLEGANLELAQTLLEAARRCEIDEEELASGIEDPAVKDLLRERTDEASSLGVFGVPTVIAAGELYWGDDRLGDAASAQEARGG
jgi:2-hydroxychromene-2-carboxylate isomerase